jgi:hypothetical protein
MAYTVNRTNGAVLTTIADGTIDTTTDLTLIGKNYSGYGELLNENFVKLLENFSSTSQPSSPVSGQLWWDTTNSLLKIYSGTAFKVISGSTSASSAPSNPIAGDLWFDSANQQLYVFPGSLPWVLIGPSFNSEAGVSGAIVETVTDSLGSNHVVVKLYTGATVVGIVSKDATFTPQSAVSGFATIAPGIQISTTITGATFKGDATNAQLLDSLDSTQFLRADTNDTTTGILTVANDSGVIVGADNDLSLSVSGANALISNATSDGDVLFRVNKSVGGVVTAVTIDGATGFVTVQSPADGDDSTKIATTAWVSDNALLLDGSQPMDGDILPTTDSTYDLGSATFKWTNVYADTLNGTAVEALYADLAERFEADAVYEPGTVVALGGTAEVTAVTEEASEAVFGVVSSKAAYLMNSKAGDNSTHPAIAMTGRVPVRVIGTVLKGQRLIASNIPGVARAATEGEANSFNVVGRALLDKYSITEGTVLAVVKIN